jgi:hypothetical protein
MSERKPTAEEFVRSVLINSFKQHVDKETVQVVAKKVKEAVATKPTPPRDSKAAY